MARVCAQSTRRRKVIPTDPKVRLRREAAAEALTDAGFPTASATLATMASRGGGPPYETYGRIPLYTWGPTLAWAESRLSAPKRSTSETDAVGASEHATGVPQTPRRPATPPRPFQEKSGRAQRDEVSARKPREPASPRRGASRTVSRLRASSSDKFVRQNDG